MLCTVCGTLNDDNLQFCSKCGANTTFHTQEHYEYHEVFNQPTNTAPNEAQAQNQQTYYQQPNNQQYSYQQPNYQQPNYQQPNYQQPNYQQPNYQQPNGYYPQPTKRDPGKVFGIVGFALAMGSLVFSDGMLLAIVGIILSAIAKKKSSDAGFNNTFANIGLIASIIVTIISAILIGFILLIWFCLFLNIY